MSELTTRLRKAAALPNWMAGAAARALYAEAAERIEQLEGRVHVNAAKAAIELATVTGHSVGEIVQLFERLAQMPPESLTTLSQARSRPKREHLSECAIAQGYGEQCTCRDYSPD